MTGDLTNATHILLMVKSIAFRDRHTEILCSGRTKTDLHTEVREREMGGSEQIGIQADRQIGERGNT